MHNPYAPRFHFAPVCGWMNDPNGCVYFNSQWHLFYQYYEPAMIDGMQWGHAIGDDLFSWKRIDPALQPDSNGQIWSGSAVVDHHDSSGLFDGKPGLVCLFTYWDKSDHRQSQGMAYSADGLTFHKYEGNPVILQLRYLDGHPDDKDFRDPKVFWHQPSGKWIMVVAGGKLRIFSSTDLKHWAFESIDESIETECPDLFEMPVDGDQSNMRWLLSLGGKYYMLGDFDGKRFAPQTEALPISGGPDFYASQSFSDAPENRRIMISWLFGWGYGTSVSPTGNVGVFPTGDQAGGCMTVPHELSLRTMPDGIRLFQTPVKELDALRIPLSSKGYTQLVASAPEILSTGNKTVDICFTIEKCESGKVGLRVPASGEKSYTCGFDSESGRLFIDRHSSGFDSVRDYCSLYQSPKIGSALPITLRMLIDTCSVEMFAADGSAHMSAYVLPDPGKSDIALFCDSSATVGNIAVHAVKPTMS